MIGIWFLFETFSNSQRIIQKKLKQINMILTIILSIAIYLLSAFLTWDYIRIAYGKDGIWSGLNATGTDVFITLFPAINTIAIIGCWLSSHPNKQIKWNYTKFFNIKK